MSHEVKSVASAGMPTQGLTTADDVSNALWSIGAADASGSQRASAMRYDELVPNQHGAYVTDSLVVLPAESTPTNSVRARAELASMDEDGFTLDWPVNNSAADLIHYIAFKMVPEPPGPPAEVLATGSRVGVGVHAGIR